MSHWGTSPPSLKLSPQLSAALLTMHWASVAAASAVFNGSTASAQEVLQAKKYCHGYQASCPLEAPLKIRQPEHNQNYQYTFPPSGDPRGPAFFPHIEIDFSSSFGKDPALDAALAAVSASPSIWQLCLRLRTGRGTDATLDVLGVGHHWCSPLDVLPELVLYPLDGLGNASASNLPIAITPCRLSLWLEPTPAAWDDAYEGVTIDEVDVLKTTGIESKTSALAAHAAALPGRSLDWTVWSSTAPLPASYFWESTKFTENVDEDGATSSGSSRKTLSNAANSAQARAKYLAQVGPLTEELLLALTQRNLNASDTFWSHEEAYVFLPAEELSEKKSAAQDATELAVESSTLLEHCPVKASPAFKSVANFGSALSAALNDGYGRSYPFSGPQVLGELSFTTPTAAPEIEDRSTVNYVHNREDTVKPYLLLIGCGYSGTRAMAAFLSQHLELPVRHEFGNVLDATPNAPGFLGPFADSALRGLAPVKQTTFTSYEAAAEAALASIAAGDVSVGGITGSADGVWTLREGSTLRSSTLGEVSYLTRFGYNTSPSSSANDKTSENVAFASTGTPSAATAAAAATRTAIPMEKREEKEANVETSLEKRRVLIQNASAWAGMAAWPMTIRLGPLPSGSRAEPFLMVRHPLKVARSALATDWNFVYKFLVDQCNSQRVHGAAIFCLTAIFTPILLLLLLPVAVFGLAKDGAEDCNIDMADWVPLSFAEAWSRLPVAFRALLWWSSFNLLGEAQLPVGRKPFRMEDVFEMGNIAPLKEMHSAAQGDKMSHESQQHAHANSPTMKEAKMEADLLGATKAGTSEKKSALGRVAATLAKAGDAIRGKAKAAAPTPSSSLSSSSSSSSPGSLAVDWESVGAAAVASPRCHAHTGGSKKKARAEVSWESLWAAQQREASNGDCAVAVAMEAVLAIAQQLCLRYGYASASCEPVG